jgi:hypothetical protein
VSFQVSTLCPKLLRPSDCINISGKKRPTLTLPCGKVRLSYYMDRFPPDTRGFLYYHTPPKAPPFVGDVRFRLANDLDSFHDGEDLLSDDNTVPWTIPSYSLANHVNACLREQLLLDGLISQMTLDEWARIKPGQRVLYYLRQPFFLRFRTFFFAFYTATREHIGRCGLTNPVVDRRSSRPVSPYGGELSLRPKICMKNNLTQEAVWSNSNLTMARWLCVFSKL